MQPCSSAHARCVRPQSHAHNLSPKTAERYRELAARQIARHIGAHALQKLKSEHVRTWHGTLIGEGLSPRTVGPAEQITDALAKLEGHPLLPIAALALATGLRRGELLGLQWGDVGLDAGTLRVERSVEETKAGLRVKPPKTKRGRRNLNLPPETIAMLRAHKVETLKVRLALGMANIVSDTLVFSTVGGDLLSPDNLSRDWRRVSTSRKLPRVSFHALRHTHASVLIRKGVDILTISRRLGHYKPSIT